MFSPFLKYSLVSFLFSSVLWANLNFPINSSKLFSYFKKNINDIRKQNNIPDLKFEFSQQLPNFIINVVD